MPSCRGGWLTARAVTFSPPYIAGALFQLLLQHSPLFFCYDDETSRFVALLRCHSIRVGRGRFWRASPSIPGKALENLFTCLASPPFPFGTFSSEPEVKAKVPAPLETLLFKSQTAASWSDLLRFKMPQLWSRLQQRACPTFVSKDVWREKNSQDSPCL